MARRTITNPSWDPVRFDIRNAAITFSMGAPLPRRAAANSCQPAAQVGETSAALADALSIATLSFGVSARITASKSPRAQPETPVTFVQFEIADLSTVLLR